jgi:hypothetical protein
MSPDEIGDTYLRYMSPNTSRDMRPGFVSRRGSPN